MSRTFRGIRASLSRREFVRLGGASLAGAALLDVAGCGGEESPAARYGPTKDWIAALTGNDDAVGHVVLLGDSIFDNATYVAGAPDVLRQVRQRLPSGSRATLAAVDGSTIGDVQRQLRRVPEDATHLVLSVGGNDALGSSDFLEAPAPPRRRSRACPTLPTSSSAATSPCWRMCSRADFPRRFAPSTTHASLTQPCKRSRSPP